MSTSANSSAAARGVLAAALAYLAWGLFPIYWHQLAAIEATELIAHRHVWSLLFVSAVLFTGSGWNAIRSAWRSPVALRCHALSGVLLTLNWLVFVWGVNHGHVLEASFGYFLVPLVNVALGRFLLREPLRLTQWLAIGFAVGGVVLMLVQVGHPPWIALALAGTFGAYGLLRKRSPLGPLAGLTLETVLLAPFALTYLAWREATGAGAFGHADLRTHLLLMGAGAVTAVPLLLFAQGARRIRFSTLGLLQYITPTVQFSIGAWLYHEPFPAASKAAFALIWCGLAIYTADNLWSGLRPIRVGSIPAPSRTPGPRHAE